MNTLRNMDEVPIDTRPYFGVRLAGGVAHTEGQASVALGKRIPVAGQRLDDGVFVDWHWDGRRLKVSNCRFGMYPLFYCAKEASIWVSPSLAHVARGNSDRELDWPALGIFHRMGHFVGADTPFADIRVLPPCSTLTWESGQLELSAESRPLGQPSLSDLSFDDAVDNYRHLFTQSIARRLPADDRFTVPISGGRDSRHILLELVHQGRRPPWCATVRYRPPATNEDMRVARVLMERLGLRHVEIDRSPSYFRVELNDVHLTNHCGGGHGWIQPLASRLGGEVRTSYDGLAGDVLSAGLLQQERLNWRPKVELYEQGDLESLARLLLQENGYEKKLRQALSDRVYRNIPLAQAVERLVPELQRHAGRPNALLSFDFWNSTRRSIASIPYAILHEVPVVHTPFIDHALVDFLITLDPAFIANNRLHDETIKRSYPGFADVPYQDKTVRAEFAPSERSYYPQARREFFSYLNKVPTPALSAVKRPYLYAKIAADLLMRRVEPPWYMRTALQAIELERLRGDY